MHNVILKTCCAKKMLKIKIQKHDIKACHRKHEEKTTFLVLFLELNVR